MPGWWDLPGGGADPGESVKAAAAREAKEEAGLNVPNLKSLGQVAKDVYAFAAQMNRIPTPRVRPNDEGILEHDAHVWVDQDSIGRYKIVAPALKAILRAWAS
jgi:8-oxo-dGTP diphosphatase